MAKILFIFSFLGMFFLGQSALAKEGSAADCTADMLKESEEFIRDLGAKAIKVLTANKMNPQQQKKEFEEIFVNNFAVKNIATFVLGKYRRRARSEEKKRFFDLFKKSIADIYTERFKNYTNESFKVHRALTSGGKSTVIRVFSEISKEGAPPIDVEWKVFKDKSGKLVISDVIVEGLSMSTTQRSEYASIIDRHRGSLTALNDILEEKLHDDDEESGASAGSAEAA